MGRLITAAVECIYKEVDRQLKEHFIHRLNGSEMLTEIIKELTESDDSMMIPSECVVIWAKKLNLREPIWQSLTACMS